MNKYSKQEIFEKAYRGLRAQKFQRSLKMRAGDFAEAFVTCAYNGNNGMHCAIGWVWPIEEKYENAAVTNIDIFDCFSASEALFLVDLQRAHDFDVRKEYTAEQMKNAFHELAEFHELQVPPDDGNDPVLVIVS